jgi:hypothetical protein
MYLIAIINGDNMQSMTLTTGCATLQMDVLIKCNNFNKK